MLSDVLRVFTAAGGDVVDTSPMYGSSEAVLGGQAREHSLPPWAKEHGIESWAQFLLKWVLSFPQVTCAIPGTGKPEHMRDNLGAAQGPLPDGATRIRMSALWKTFAR